jgi:glycosyltransferase involved in cell wall biosynthesis
MKVLLSAFSCSPNQGSEPGLGWNWALEIARLGHEVVVLTQTEARGRIEAELASGRLPPGLSFEFFMPVWLERFRLKGLELGYESLTWHLTHLMWQLAAYSYARRHLLDRRFDLVHHITFAGIRHPTLLGRLPIPLVLGPLGGGERAPWALRWGLGFRGLLLEAIRDAHTFLIRFDPITRRACADALVIYVKTEQSRAALPRRHRSRAVVQLEIGTGPQDDRPKPPRAPGAPLRLLYAGRLLYWKGMHLGLKALAEVRSRGVDARLTMLGSGPAEEDWRRLAAQLGIDHAVQWLARIEHDRMADMYRSHDAVLFPSLHDSGGTVALEALLHGTPVVCLDLGGPAVTVSPSCGRIVATAARGEGDVVRGLVDALEELARSETLLDELSRGARARAQAFRWPTLVRRVYDDIARRLQRGVRDEAVLARDTAQPAPLTTFGDLKGARALPGGGSRSIPAAPRRNSLASSANDTARDA